MLHPLNAPRKHRRALEHEQAAREKPIREFSVGDRVLYWDEHNRVWKKASVAELEGTKLLVMQAESGTVRKHLDHVVRDNTKPDDCRSSERVELGKSVETHTRKTRIECEPGVKPNLTVSEPFHKPCFPSHEPVLKPETALPSPTSEISDGGSPPLSRPKRDTGPPIRLTYDKLGG